MTYLERLSPWCIVKLLPNMQRQVVARCRCRNDAEKHLRILRRLLPSARFAIAFAQRWNSRIHRMRGVELILETAEGCDRKMGAEGDRNTHPFCKRVSYA
jgi:hypothetical protein